MTSDLLHPLDLLELQLNSTVLAIVMRASLGGWLRVAIPDRLRAAFLAQAPLPVRSS